jgi:hypothetical protein
MEKQINNKLNYLDIPIKIHNILTHLHHIQKTNHH